MSNKPVKNDTERPVVALIENCIFIHPLRYGLVRKSEYVGLAQKFFPLPKSHIAAKVLAVDDPPVITEQSAATAQFMKNVYSYGTANNSTIPHAKDWIPNYSYHTRIPKCEDIFAEEVNEPTTPDRFSYEFAACPLRNGWLYTFESVTKIIKEYSVSSVNGVIQCKLRRFNNSGESRLQTTNSSQPSYKGIPVARQIKQLQLNFCEVQWDASLLQDLINADKREILDNFHSIDVAKWVKQEQPQDGVFSREDIQQYYIPAYTDTVDFEEVYKERLAPSVDAINHPFVCVHDRWGAASDICEDIARLEKLHEAIIHSSKTGLAVGTLLKELLNDPVNGVANAKARHPKSQQDITFDDFEKQYLLAASTYNAIELELTRHLARQSGTDEVLKELRKQSKQVDWPTIHRILNVVARKSMRTNINNTRMSLLAVLESDYYNLSIKEVPDGFADKLYESKNILIAHDQYVIREPRARDVDIINNYEKRLDLSSFYEKKLAENSEYSKQIKKVIGVGEGLLEVAKGAHQVLNILDTYIGYFDGEKEIKILTGYLNSVNFRELDFEVQLSPLNKILEYAEDISMEERGRTHQLSGKNQISRAIYEHLDAGSSIPHIRIKPKATNAIKATQQW
ncbi:MAG: hypothetical protein LC643_03085, partial [Bacteroidales bacterium]|nr:hypothetical protein [Bacteroidales bacterium]